MPVGSQPLDEAGLVAFTRCGHWWVYPCHPTAAQMHDLARFNLGIACSFCLAKLQAAQLARIPGTTWRLN